MRVFPPRVLRVTKQYDATGLMRATASLWGLWSGAKRSGTKHTVSPVLAAPGCERTRQRQLTTRRKAGKTCPPSEDLEDLEQSGKAFKSGEEEAGNY